MADDLTGGHADGAPKDPAGPDPTTTPTGTGPGDGGTPTDPAPQDGGGNADTDPADGGNGDGGGDGHPSDRSANRQAAKYRTRAKEAEAERDRLAAEYAAAKEAAAERDELKKRFDDLAKVLNPDAPADTPPDPAELAKQLEDERKARESETADYQRQIRELTVQNVLPDLFRDAKLDPVLAAAMLRNDGAMSSLDPAAESFADDAKAAVDQLAEKYPQLKVKPAGPPRSGTEPTGPSGGTGQLTLEQYRRLSMEDKEKAQKDGRLRNLLGG